MEVESLGHASLLVRTADVTILMDPALCDPIQEGVSVVCPARELSLERMPQYDLIVISHKHTDHFDIQTLAQLDRNAEVVIPADDFMEGYLRQLGYERITKLKDYSKLKIGSTSLFTTRSENPVPEFGVIFSDPSATVWNQVDSRVSVDVVRTVLAQYPTIDLVLSGWQPMLEVSYQSNQSLAFPYELYGHLLSVLGYVQPRAVAPGSNGYKFIGDRAWLNRVVFPVSRAEFQRDVLRTCPHLKEDDFITLYPGDVAEVENGRARRKVNASEWVRTLRDDTSEIAFSPVTIGMPFLDGEEPGIDAATREAIIADIETKLVEELKGAAFLEHRHWRVVYQLEVGFRSESQTWTVDFAPPVPRIERGASPVANLFSYITASTYAGLLRGTTGWDGAYLGGRYRTFSKIHCATPAGLVRPDQPLADPLFLHFPYEQAQKALFDSELKRWST